MDSASISKRSYSVLNATSQRSEDGDNEEPPLKKKLRTKLVDLFDRASLCLIKTPADRMKIYLRIKPFTANEDSSQRCFVVAPEENTIVATAPSSSHAHKSMKRGVGKSSHKFTFSKIFNEDTSQAQFFNESMLDMTKDFIAGQNSLVFTYGVTSSGKTYTIQGKPQDAGVLPRCLDVIFNSINGKQIPSLTLKPKNFTDIVRLTPEEISVEKKIKDKTFRLSANNDTAVKTLLGDEMESALSETGLSTSDGTVESEEFLTDVVNRAREVLKVDVEDQGKILFGVWVSFAEIYNETVYDLLEPMPSKKNARRQGLKICDDKNGNPYIKGLKEINVESADEAYKLLSIGQRNLQTACTRLNHCSSRSHCIYNVKIVRITDKSDAHVARVNMLSFCDLAGSERYSKTQATGDRLKEAGNINSSLMTLSRCIETLRHNQMHRDKPRLVPFRESKLTRLLQNFFNGSGRAVMIVNVSQCPQMFDDTLHVFHFSAIAKQVKYVEQPVVESVKVKKKTNVERGSIAWESPEKETQVDLTTESDETNAEEDDDCEEKEENSGRLKELEEYVQGLEARYRKLLKLYEEEIDAHSETENRVRKEVTEALMKQVVAIEENYSTMLKETREEGQELADERVRGIMEVYEEKLERVQKKIDEDDEWVSSLLYHQEQLKVQERDATINELRKEIANLQTAKNLSADQSFDLGNTVLIESLTLKLQESLDKSKKKDEKIAELESLIAEAAEDYNKHASEISQLKEICDHQKKSLEQKQSSIKDMEKQLTLKDASCFKVTKKLELKETEIKALEEDLQKKLKSKDSTILSLEEEIKEMHDEIERLQDQMSLINEQSKCTDIESSRFSEKLKSSDKQNENLSCTETSLSDVTKKKTRASNVCTSDLSITNFSVKENDNFKKFLEKDERINQLESENEKMAVELKNLQEKLVVVNSKCESLLTENNVLHEKIDKINDANKNITETNELLKKENISLQQELDILETTQEELKIQLETLKTASEKNKTHFIDQQNNSKTKNLTQEVNIMDLVRQLEGKGTPNTVKTAVLTKVTPCEESTNDVLLKLKNAELANTALRSKLKKEEEDFFQREQALIHGYTAEIDTLKYELAKLKSKMDVPNRTRPLRGKRKAVGVDVSACSVNSESFCDSSESGIDINKEENVALEKNSSVVLQDEILSLQKELLSLTATYSKLQKEKNTEPTNRLMQDVVNVASKSRPSTFGIFRSEENVGDSLIQFEIEEYVIKMEDLKLKIQQQELEINECNKALVDEKILSKELKMKLEEEKRCLEKLNSELIKEKTTLISELDQCKQLSNNNVMEIEQLNGKLNILQVEKERIEKLPNDEKIMCCELKNQWISFSSTKDLENEHKALLLQLQDDLKKALTANAEKDSLLKLVEEKENASDARQDEIIKENKILLKDIEIVRLENEQLLIETKKLSSSDKELQQQLQETVEKLNGFNVSYESLKKELSELRVALDLKEKTIQELEKKSSTLLTQQKECVNEKHSQSQQISHFHKQLEDMKAELNAKTKELEMLTGKNQEDAAEVAQKLLTLERDKKLAERKAMEAKEREEEWRAKCQGLDKMQQLEKELHEKLKTTADTLRKQREEIVALKEELTLKNEELEKLYKEKEKVKSKHEEHYVQIKELEHQNDLEKESLKKEYVEQINCLKMSLSEADEITTEHEQIIGRQDEKLLSLKAEIDCISTEKEKIEKLLFSRDIEIANLNNQLIKLEENLKRSEAEHKEKISSEQMQKMSWEKSALKEKFHSLEKEKLHLEEKVQALENLLKKEKDNLEELEKKCSFTEKQKSELEKWLKDTNEELGQEKEKFEKEFKEKTKALEKITQLESEISNFKNDSEKELSETNQQKNVLDNLEEAKRHLKKEVETLLQDIENKEEMLKQANKVKQNLNKELQKLQRLNERNREEMENWKKEKDVCVSQLEQLINKRQNENKLLTEEIAQLKIDNADLVKNVESISTMKDSIIADLRKSNNTLSIEISKLQGISPPSATMSPGNFWNKREFIEDNDTTGHLEIDATPPAAVKKSKKLGSLKLLHSNLLSSSVDPDSTPGKKALHLKTIEEQVEKDISPYTPQRAGSPSKTSLQSAAGKVVELASEFLTPLTRSARKKEKEHKKNKKTTETFDSDLTPSSKEESENFNPMGTRRSSRLRCKTKQ